MFHFDKESITVHSYQIFFFFWFWCSWHRKSPVQMRMAGNREILLLFESIQWIDTNNGWIFIKDTRVTFRAYDKRLISMHVM